MRDELWFAAAIGFAVGVALVIGSYELLAWWWGRRKRRERVIRPESWYLPLQEVDEEVRVIR